MIAGLLVLACADALPSAGMEVTDALSVQALGDLDRDGRTDWGVAMGSQDGGGVGLHLFLEGIPLGETWDAADEDRQRSAWVVPGADSDQTPRILAPGDLDGDRYDDLFIGWCAGDTATTCDPESRVIWGRETWSDNDATPADLTASGAGALAAPHPLADLDGDDLADLIGGTPEAPPTDLLLGSADRWQGALGPEDLITWSGDVEILQPVGDVDGDGLGDVVTQGADCALSWKSGAEDFDDFEANPTQAEVLLPDPGWGAVVPGPAGDLDGDGIDDWWLRPTGAVSGCEDPDPDAGLVLVQGRSGGPDLLYAAVLAPAGDAALVDIVGGGDWDDDGHDDLILLTEHTGAWTVLPGADVVFGAPGHLLGTDRVEQGVLGGAWWLGKLDEQPGDELAIGVLDTGSGGYTRVTGHSTGP